MCKYCITYEDIYNDYKYSNKKEDSMYGISVHIENNIMMIDASGDTYESSYVEAEIKINYCPMCGRKLE